ncbi:hypothetical protein ACTQ2Q_09930 [Atopobiaceae bacterium LCP21S3_F11]
MTSALLADIITHGNRGHYGHRPSWMTCADGTQLSVIAGGGCYCLPRVARCCATGAHQAGPSWPDDVPCDYPGPYTHVEVLVDGGFDDDPCLMSVAELHELIASHGGIIEEES